MGDTLTVVNDGTMQHNLAIDGGTLATPMIDPGDNQRLVLTGMDAGTYKVLCAVPGHRDIGMTAQLVLTAASPGLAITSTGMAMGAGATSSDQMTPAQSAAMDEAMAKSTKAFPARTEGLGGQPLPPTVLPDGTKQFDLTAEIVNWEVSPGKIVKAGPTTAPSQAQPYTSMSAIRSRWFCTTACPSPRSSISTVSMCLTPWTVYRTSPRTQ